MSANGLPADTYVELTTDLVGEGKLVEEMDAAIREAHTALRSRRERGETGGACTITATITLAYDPQFKEHVLIKHAVGLKTPKNEYSTMVKEKGEVLLCQPEGSNAETPDQLRLFDASGRPRGVLDKRTGEVTEAKDVAGRVGAAG